MAADTRRPWKIWTVTCSTAEMRWNGLEWGSAVLHVWEGCPSSVILGTCSTGNMPCMASDEIQLYYISQEIKEQSREGLVASRSLHRGCGQGCWAKQQEIGHGGRVLAEMLGQAVGSSMWCRWLDWTKTLAAETIFGIFR